MHGPGLGLEQIQNWDTTENKIAPLYPLFEKYLCVPATSVSVERLFRHGGVITRPHRAKLSDKALHYLVLKVKQAPDQLTVKVIN